MLKIMVQHIETIARIAGNQGALDLTEDLKQVVQKHRGKSPEVLEGVIVYDKNSDENLYRHSKFDHYRLDQRLVLLSGDEKRLTPTENRLLTVFEKEPNKLRSRAELLERVFGKEYTAIYLSGYVGRLRRKIEDNTKTPEVIISMYGQGYLFRDPSKDAPVEPRQEEEIIYLYAGSTYHPERRLVVVDGRDIHLSPIENKLLDLLARHSNAIITHRRLIDGWEDKGDGVDPKDILKKNINRLRRKLELDKSKRDYGYIVSVRGVGYMLVDPTVFS